MRTRALTLENISGFEVDQAGLLLFPPVFRATPSLFNLQGVGAPEPAQHRRRPEGHRHRPARDQGSGSLPVGRVHLVSSRHGVLRRHFFHTGLLGNNTVVIPGETPRFANLRQAVAFYVSMAFADSPEGSFFPAILALTDADLDDIAHFLERISGG
jgi:hypothetical protein